MSHPIPYALAITDIATSHPLSLVMLPINTSTTSG